MQTCLLILGVLFTNQVAGSDGPRYAPVLPSGSGSKAAVSQPFSAQPKVTESQGATTQPSENPLRPGTRPQGSSPMGAAPATSTPATSMPASRPAATPTAPAKLTKVEKPVDLLKNLVTPATQQKLMGAPLSLADTVKGARSREEQSRRVRLYWELSKAVSHYYLTTREEIDLQSQRSGLLQAGQVWTDAQQAAAGRKTVAMNAVKAAQLRLQKELGRTSEASLPVPTDLPHCGAYETKYERIFQARTSHEAKQLAELLPLCHRQMTSRATETSEALEWHSLVSQQRSVQSDTRLLLKAYEQLALQRRAFVDAAYQYNANIARYTELAVPQDIGTVRLVSMLIQTNGNWQEGAIQRASAQEPGSSGNVAGRYPPRTFGQGARNETRRVPTDGAESERSILVSPEGSAN